MKLEWKMPSMLVSQSAEQNPEEPKWLRKQSRKNYQSLCAAHAISNVIIHQG